MRVLSASLMAILAAVAITACSSSSNSSDQSGSSAATDTTAASPAATDAAAAAAPAGTSAATTSDMPSYPGASVMAAGSTMGMGSSGNAAGKVMSTGDSFDKVYAWYQKNMPAGSEKAHTTSPIQSAVFTIGETGKDQKSVTITTQGGKTMITIAHVKM